MARQFKSTDDDKWLYGFGDGSAGNGSINTSTDAPIDSACSGTTGTTSLTATNASFASGQLVLIHQTRGTGAGNWELNRIASYTAGTITLSHLLQNTYTNSGASVAQVLVMKQYNNLTINSGQTLTAKAWNGTVGGIIAYFVKGTVTINGTISALGGNATDTTGNPGSPGQYQFKGGAYGNPTPWSGEGTGGASNQTYAANGNGGCGAATSPTSTGAGGGHAFAGTNGSNGNAGGLAVGTASLTNMNFGGGGGGGRDTGNPPNAGAGGGGGGIVFIVGSNIVISGLISVNGGNTGSNYWKGGNGAGGSVLLKCVTATLGTNKITSLAGTGAGTTASVGRIHLDYKTSYTGTTNPTLDATQDLSLDYPSMGGSLLYSLLN